MADKKIVKKTILIINDVIIEQSVSFKKEGFISLFNAQHIYIKLNSKQRCFFDFLCEKMNYKNEVLINGELREEFSFFLNKITSGGVTVSKRSFFDYMGILEKLRLIIPFKNANLLYVVNPKYVYKGTYQNRIEVLNDLMDNHLTNGIDIQALLNVSISDITIPEIPYTKFITYEDGSIEILD